MKKKGLDNFLANYADSTAAGGERRSAPSRGPEVAAEWRDEGKVLMNTIQELYKALCPVSVPEALAARVREQVRQEITGRARQTAGRAETRTGLVAGLKTAAQAFLRRAGELVVNVNLGELLRGKGTLERGRPAEVYAYSVIEALDKAARRRKGRILVDARGRIYEVPQSVLRRCSLPTEKTKRRRK